VDEPVWIEEKLVMAIHERQLAEHGGSSGVRDRGMLESALARARQKWAYGADVDMATLAAAYAFGLARNHPFVDGNKRTAAVVSELFLELNHHVLAATDMDLFPVCMAIASGEMREDELTAWMRANVRPNQVSESRGSYA